MPVNELSPTIYAAGARDVPARSNFEATRALKFCSSSFYQGASGQGSHAFRLNTLDTYRRLLLNFCMHHAGPPHNPGVRELVAGKRKWASALTIEQAKAGFKGWHERGYLPHRDEPGLVQMVTFHLADSFPASLRSEWEALLVIQDNDERRKRLQAYLNSI